MIVQHSRGRPCHYP